MTFQFGPIPDPDKDGIMEVHHYRRAVDDYDRDGALMDSPMLHGWFVYNVVELALGEDAILKYSPREIFEKLEEMSTSHQEYIDLMECKDAQEADELFNPNPLTA